MGVVDEAKVDTEMVIDNTSQKSSKDEGSPQDFTISDETNPQKDNIPLMPHSDVEKLLRIIKETDEEFREKEQQILDAFERSEREKNIKEMEKELKKQKKSQEKLRKENEKAQKRQEKLEQDAMKKKKKKKKKKKNFGKEKKKKKKKKKKSNLEKKKKKKKKKKK